MVGEITKNVIENAPVALGMGVSGVALPALAGALSRIEPVRAVPEVVPALGVIGGATGMMFADFLPKAFWAGVIGGSLLVAAGLIAYRVTQRQETSEQIAPGAGTVLARMSA